MRPKYVQNPLFFTPKTGRFDSGVDSL